MAPRFVWKALSLSRERAVVPLVVCAWASWSVAGCGGETVFGVLDGPGGFGGEPAADSCSFADYDLEAPRNSMNLAFGTFWSQGVEFEAVDVLAQSAERGPFDFRTTFGAGRTQLLDDLESQLGKDYETIPDVFQVNGGSDVLQWVGSNHDVSQVCAIDGLDPEGFRSRYFASVLEPVTCRGELFALPLGIHRVNHLFYNAELLEQIDQALGHGRSPDQVLADLTTPERFADYLEAISELQLEASSGRRVIPLGLGNRETWPLGILAFDNLMASIDGLYEAVWQGKVSGTGVNALLSSGLPLEAELERWLELVQRCVAQSAPEEERSWRDALKLVERGEAVFSVMGNWGIAEVSAAPGGEIGSTTFPPTQGVFIYTPDSMVVPRIQSSQGQAAHFFLQEVVDHLPTMLSFSNKKHSIPPRSDLTRADLQVLDDPRLRTSYEEFRACDRAADSCRLLLAVSGLAPPPFRDPCFDETWTLLAKNAWGRLGTVHPKVLAEEQAGQRLAGREPCRRAFPSEPEAAGREAISRLVDLTSRQPYSSACWK